jgi:hypothetical protein
MKKKNILIAILFTAIFLLVPLTNVSGGSVGGLNTKEGIVEVANPDIPYHMFEELVELINQLLVAGSDIPFVFDMCNDALEMINPILEWEIFEGICIVTGMLFWTFGIVGILLFIRGFRELATYCELICALNLGIGIILFCDWILDVISQENNLFKNGIGLNPQINLENISEYDITVIQEFIQSYELNGCPCIYE